MEHPPKERAGTVTSSGCGAWLAFNILEVDPSAFLKIASSLTAGAGNNFLSGREET